MRSRRKSWTPAEHPLEPDDGHANRSMEDHSIRNTARFVRERLQIDTLGCGSSIQLNGRFGKLWKTLALGAGFRSGRFSQLAHPLWIEKSLISHWIQLALVDGGLMGKPSREVEP